MFGPPSLLTPTSHPPHKMSGLNTLLQTLKCGCYQELMEELENVTGNGLQDGDCPLGSCALQKERL